MAKYEWDLTKIFPDSEIWNQKVKELEGKIGEWEASINAMDKSIDNLKASIQMKIIIDNLIEQIYCYPKRYLDLNNQNKEMIELFEIAKSLYSKILKLTETFVKKLTKEKKLLNQFLKSNAYYQRYIETLLKNNNENQLESIENIKEIYRTLTENDLTFGLVEDEEGNKITLTKKRYQDLIISKKKSVRKEAMIVYNTSYEKIKNTLAVLLNQKYRLEIKGKEKYQTLLEKILADLELPTNVVTNLITTTHKYIKMQTEYLNLKKDFLNKEEFHIYDTALPLGLISKMEIEIEDATKMIKEALSILGNEYTKKIDTAFEEGWLDLLPKKNKRKMSYSCISYCGVPYTLLNYNKSITSTRTLAHELGHAIHTSYAKENPFEYFEYSLFLSEIVSKVNEILFNEYLLNQDISKDEQIYLLNNIVSSLGNTLFGQTMLTEFELNVISKIEDNQFVNAENLGSIYKDIFNDYHRNKIILDVDNSIDWAKIPLFVMQPAYYVYQYPIGLSLALEIVKKLKDNKKDYEKKYIEFLKIGNTKSIIESLAFLEIDLEGTEYIENAFKYLEKHINLLKKVKK